MNDNIDDNERRRWYAEGLRFECARCGACCGGEPGYVWVTAAEIEKMARHLGLSVDAFGKQHLRRVGRRFSLREKPNGDCCLLDGKCTVYPVRPRQCVSWPFWPENIASRPEWGRHARRMPRRGPGAAVRAARNRLHRRRRLLTARRRKMQTEKHIAVKREIFYDDPALHDQQPADGVRDAGRCNDTVEIVEIMCCLDADSPDPTNEMIECMETKSRLLGRGHKPLAIFRSHADGDAVPTGYEIETYSDPGVMLVIVSLQQGGVPLVKAYEIVAARAHPVRIEVE